MLISKKANQIRIKFKFDQTGACTDKIQTRDLQPTYGARGMGVMQESDMHNLTGIASAPDEFRIQF